MLMSSPGAVHLMVKFLFSPYLVYSVEISITSTSVIRPGGVMSLLEMTVEKCDTKISLRTDTRRKLSSRISGTSSSSSIIKVKVS